MTFQSALQPLYSPYVAAGRTLVKYAIVIYKALTSDVAQDIYKLLWVILQVAFWMSVLAIHNTIESGRAFRGFYEAEWADAVNWMLEYPDRCLESEVTSETAEPPDDCLTTETLAVTVTVEDNTQTATPAIPEALQVIIDSGSSTMTTKLRKIASYYGIRWRNARGEGKHMRNADLKRALQDLCPEVIAVL